MGIDGPLRQTWPVDPAPHNDLPSAEGDVVSVRRSGGFAGLTSVGSVALVGDDPRVGQVRDLVGRVDLGAVVPTQPRPDMFVYSFELPGQPALELPEHDLTDDLRSLARLVLGD